MITPVKLCKLVTSVLMSEVDQINSFVYKFPKVDFIYSFIYVIGVLCLPWLLQDIKGDTVAQ